MIGANYIARRRKTENAPGERHSVKRGIGRPWLLLVAPVVGIVGIPTTENHHAMGDAPTILICETIMRFIFFLYGLRLKPRVSGPFA